MVFLIVGLGPPTLVGRCLGDVGSDDRCSLGINAFEYVRLGVDARDVCGVYSSGGDSIAWMDCGEVMVTAGSFRDPTTVLEV